MKVLSGAGPVGVRYTAMVWSEGDVWTAELDLPEGSVAFKFVLRGEGGGEDWEEGSNRTILVRDFLQQSDAHARSLHAATHVMRLSCRCLEPPNQSR